MTVSTVNLVNLRNAKNAVIGNPSAKVQLSRDSSFINSLVDCLNHHDARSEIRIEAAHVVASLSYGSDEALVALLRANAPHALLFALAHFTKDDSSVIRAAFARALRAIAVSAADAVGPSQWGLGPASSIAEDDAHDTLEFLFHASLLLPLNTDALDTLLPLLTDVPISQVPTSICQLIASVIRSPHQRVSITEWLPLNERTKAKEKEMEGGINIVRPRRGWEKAVVAQGPARMGGWTVRQLVALLGAGDVKLQEAALGALAALAKDNVEVSGALSRPGFGKEGSPLTTILNMTKSRSSDVQIAACLCAAHILRALPRQQQDESSTRLVMNTLNRMIASPLSPSEELGLPHHSSYSFGSGGDSVGAGGGVGMIGQVSISQRTKACFVLYHLVSDDASLCQAAFDRGCLAQLVGLVSALPLPPTPPSLLAEVESLSILNGPGVDVPEGGGMRAGAISGGDGGGGARVKGGIRVYVPPPEDDNKMEDDEDWCEPEGRALLREAALTAIAAISLFDNDVRRSLAEPNIYPSYHQHTSFAPFPSHASSSSLSPPPTSNLNSSPAPLIPVLLAGIVHPSAGVRYASCQSVRAMSRAVAVLRTNIVDSGLGIGVWRRCVKGPTVRRKHPDETITPSRDKVKEQWEGERDTRVLLAGLAVVCNLVNDFSPLRSVLLEDGLVERLREILDMGVSEDQMEDEQQSEPGGEGEVKRCSTEHVQLKISALWAVKNLLFKSELNLKSQVMNVIGWDKIARFLGDYDTGIREQALNVLRNVTENEAGVDLVNKEIGEDELLDHVANALKSTNDDIVLQAAYLLGNLANAKASHLAQILSHPRLLPALHSALVAATITVSSSHSPSSMTPSATLSSSNHVAQSYRAQARGPLVSCVAQLAAGGAAQVKAAGFEGALKHVVEWTGGGLGGGRGTHGGWDDDRPVALEARNALMLIEKA